MISKALELRGEIGREGNGWCMSVVSHGYGGLGGCREGGGGGRHAGQSRGVGRMSGDAGAYPECEVIH